MAASPEQREHAVQRASKIFAIIKDAAERGIECPTNKVFRERFNCGTQPIVNAFAFLEANGMIEVERMASTRVVTICATGKRTGGQSGEPHWCAKVTRRAA